ncbi:MAG TPA: helix-turn-helix domain-containing protein [Caulobacteraceae bacterium]|jgi:DNA-binding MarR family transcriptional regulator|nr:helix-turn-helix domain-containing protein [Caulobacteraceae bacterium]
MSLPAAPLSAEARLFLREEELDAALELFLLAEAALATAAEGALESEAPRLGRGHWRAAFLLKRRPGMGVQELSRLTGLSKQGASRVMSDLAAAGYIEKSAGELDARRRPALLTSEGAAFEQRVSERLRSVLTRAYRTGGLDAVAGARRILAALAGPRNAPRPAAGGPPP